MGTFVAHWRHIGRRNVLLCRVLNIIQGERYLISEDTGLKVLGQQAYGSTRGMLREICVIQLRIVVRSNAFAATTVLSVPIKNNKLVISDLATNHVLFF